MIARTSKHALLLLLPVFSGCFGDRIGSLANTDEQDTTLTSSYSAATGQDGTLLSAFYGLDDAIPFLASYRICGGFGHQDGMPVIFSKEVDANTVQAGDFLFTLADGSQLKPACVTPAPAEDLGEFRTILTIGDFGSIKNQPVTVEVVGNLISLDQQTNFMGSKVNVTQLELGPTLIHAEPVPEDEWELDKQATALPFGGGSGCPTSTQQIIRVVWTGGVTKPGGDEIDDLERQAYRVTIVGDNTAPTTVTPFAIGDLGDGDNNHELCLDVETTATRVEFPAGLLTDPREDLNPATAVAVSR